ncbi:MAG TPA: alkaline phosphatase family protein [Candidatus Binataceae bacterium]
MADLNSIGTIVVVMMENRSFDHLLGYLSLPGPNRLAVDGIQDSAEWRRRFANPGPPNNFMYEATPLTFLHVADPPHERSNIKIQLGERGADGAFPMKGFIQSAGGNSQVMQYYAADTVPITDFFSHNFALCDRWFAPLPAGTQANRLMAMSGQSAIDTNVSNPVNFPDQQLAYDWLNQHQVRWRVYHQGFFPFFAMMPRWYPQMVVGDEFRRFERLKLDFELETDATFPQVIFVEPKYTDSPHIGEGTDDHSPSSVLGGQALLLDIYNALISNPLRWRKTVMILTYDEHGGFFDHVQPLPIATKDPRGRYADFISTGVRVPSIIISPLVSPGKIYSQALDHTSILKFLGQKFGGGKYGPGVDDRPGVGSVLDVLDLNAPRQLIPPAPDASVIPAAEPYVRGFKTQTENVKIFQDVTHQLTNVPEFRHALATKFPEYRDFLGI